MRRARLDRPIGWLPRYASHQDRCRHPILRHISAGASVRYSGWWDGADVAPLTGPARTTLVQLTLAHLTHRRRSVGWQIRWKETPWES